MLLVYQKIYIFYISIISEKKIKISFSFVKNISVYFIILLLLFFFKKDYAEYYDTSVVD